MVKKGDTLIEVTLAVGIFSLVAIAVVAVVNNSTSGAQTALETTLTREEIDTQAEALRFIQSSYINSDTIDLKGDEAESDLRYKELWEKITKDPDGIAKSPAALSLDGSGDLTYQLDKCQELYDPEGLEGTNNRLWRERAFVINPQKLGSGSIDEAVVFIRDGNNNKKFVIASTYPRIVYENDPDELTVNTEGQNVSRVEGLYVMAVEGPKTLVVGEKDSVIDASNNKLKPIINEVAAYYDFYIRSCWYESGATAPTTVSTLMRLYNPDVIKFYPPEEE